MHSAALGRSPRLQRVLAVLQDGAEHSTLDLIREAQVCAVNSCIAELRDNGCWIECRQEAGRSGERVWLYRLVSSPQAGAA